MRCTTWTALCLAGALSLGGGPGPAQAGGAWIPEAGSGTLAWGLSRKTADTSWNAYGRGFANSGAFENHDFRYGYLDGEVGLGRGWALRFLVTYLDGREGPDGLLERNAGPSDAWFALKYALGDGARPQALDLEVRTPIFYDIPGPYSRDLYDDDGQPLGHSPEWRGLLKHDVTLSYLVSGSLERRGGWWNARAGYTWREGAPADQLQLAADAGRRLPWRRAHLKLSAQAALSAGNDSPRRPEDRFGARPDFNFNDASMLRGSVSLITALDARDRWRVEVGFAQWLWGESARQYEEPFLSVSRAF